MPGLSVGVWTEPELEYRLLYHWKPQFEILVQSALLLRMSASITGILPALMPGFPDKYTANPSGTTNDCAVNCALRSSSLFAALNETIIYTFVFRSRQRTELPHL